MDSIEKTHSNCKYFDTFKCLLRRYHDLMDIKLCFELFPSGIITVDEYLEVKEKCDKVCAGCDIFRSKKTDENKGSCN